MVTAGDRGNAACLARLPEGACDAHFAKGRKHTRQKIVHYQFQIPNGNGWFAEVPANLPECLKRVSPGRAAKGSRAGSWKVRDALLTSPHHLRVLRAHSLSAWEAETSHSAPRQRLRLNGLQTSSPPVTQFQPHCVKSRALSQEQAEPRRAQGSYCSTVVSHHKHPPRDHLPGSGLRNTSPEALYEEHNWVIVSLRTSVFPLDKQEEYLLSGEVAEGKQLL